jgi:hypothetical protein
MSDLRYPIGKFHYDGVLTGEQKQKSLDDIANAPANLRAAVEGLSEIQLDTPYRPGGWTVRQVVHHVPDSHMNAYIRFKLALTEDEPTIKPYEQQLWADLGDTKSTPIEVSLTLLDSLHDRWVQLLRSFSATDWKRTFRHPELGVVSLEKNLALYAWHGRHHVAHITELRKRQGW